MTVLGPGCAKTCLSQGCAELLSQFPSLDRAGKCNWFSHRQNREGISTRKLNVRVLTQVRRETGKEQVVQVHYDEGIANHIGPEPCAGNRNKKCITLDPMKPEGQEVMRRLVTTADVVVANLPPRTLRAMKLDYESLKAIKPDVILTTATAFGGPGPWSCL